VWFVQLVLGVVLLGCSVLGVLLVGVVVGVWLCPRRVATLRLPPLCFVTREYVLCFFRPCGCVPPLSSCTPRVRDGIVGGHGGSTTFPWVSSRTLQGVYDRGLLGPCGYLTRCGLGVSSVDISVFVMGGFGVICLGVGVGFWLCLRM
jgi:hypothetical protein